MAGQSDGQAIFTSIVGEIGGIGVPFWVPLVAALLTGLALGWLIWGGKKDKGDDLSPRDRVRMKAAQARQAQAFDRTGEPAIDELFTGDALVGDAPQAMTHGGPHAPNVQARIAEIEKEIAQARAELAEKSSQADQFTDDLNSLDSSVNRANGRLRLLSETVREKLGSLSASA